MKDKPPIPVLELTSVGYAVLGEEGLVWCNQSFGLQAEEAGCTVEHLAGRYASAAIEHDGWRLIELPASAASAAPTPVELDPTTGVLSRAAIDQKLRHWFADREAKPFALGFVDLDHFKQLNDQHGHLAGDACLQEVGARLATAIRAGDLVGRFGGDEFVLLLAGVTTPEAAQPVALRLAASIAAPIEGDLWRAELGLSIGFAYSNESVEGPEGLIASADRAMYAAKRRQSGVVGPPRVG